MVDDPILRELAENAWRNIPTQPHAGHVMLDEWVVMPNHLHGILMLINDQRRGEAGRMGFLGAKGGFADLPRPYPS